jgi:hypothetical protein
MMYLSLLYPPPGSLHKAIPATNIVFAGDSAGGNLAFALLQLLLHFHRSSPSPRLRFHGAEVDAPLPAGLAGNSPWLDITRSLPSITTNTKYDYLPAANHDSDALARFPKDDIWPADPPRGDLFTDLSLVDHPLVSPLVAPDWSNSPPIWINTGEECLTDEDNFVTSLAASQGVVVQYEQYEAMPHCFPMLLPTLPQADRCMVSWGTFCRACVENPGSLESKGVWIAAKGGAEKSVDLKSVSALSLEQVKGYVQDAKDRRLRSLGHSQHLVKISPGTDVNRKIFVQPGSLYQRDDARKED